LARCNNWRQVPILDTPYIYESTTTDIYKCKEGTASDFQNGTAIDSTNCSPQCKNEVTTQDFYCKYRNSNMQDSVCSDQIVHCMQF
jgi:hypothetical protein